MEYANFLMLPLFELNNLFWSDKLCYWQICNFNKFLVMADVRLLVQEEGRAARNLVAFNVPIKNNGIVKVTHKPPSIPRVLQSTASKLSIKSSARVRSASTGRDKRSGKYQLENFHQHTESVNTIIIIFQINFIFQYI